MVWGRLFGWQSPKGEYAALENLSEEMHVWGYLPAFDKLGNWQSYFTNAGKYGEVMVDLYVHIDLVKSWVYS